MKSYSIDLMERVWRAVEEMCEETQLEVAEDFGVSRVCTGKLRKQWRDCGWLAARPRGGGRPAKYAHTDLEKLRAEVPRPPDATLEEPRLRTAALGSIMAVDWALKKLYVCFKKIPAGGGTGPCRCEAATPCLPEMACYRRSGPVGDLRRKLCENQLDPPLRPEFRWPRGGGSLPLWTLANQHRLGQPPA
jgi:transposase